MVTTDKNIRYQQNLRIRKIALVVLEHSQWPMVKLVAAAIAAAVNVAEPGSYVEVDVPLRNNARSRPRTGKNLRAASI